jgi:hypothetical protein
MKVSQYICLKSWRLLASLSLGAVSLGLTACTSTSPVHEQTVIQKTTQVRPGVYTTQTYSVVEPVGERVEVAPLGRPLLISRANDSYFDPMSSSWERPAPWGPQRMGSSD